MYLRSLSCKYEVNLSIQFCLNNDYVKKKIFHYQSTLIQKIATKWKLHVTLCSYLREMNLEILKFSLRHEQTNIYDK